MRIRLRFGVTLDLDRARDDEPEQFEHRDTEALAERADEHPIGFRVPTSGDE